MGEDRRHVEVQDNGARVIVSAAPADMSDLYGDLDAGSRGFGPARPRRRRRDWGAPRGGALAAAHVSSGAQPWWLGLSYGAAAATGCGVLYNGIVYGLGIDLRILALAVGWAVGAAVQAGTPPKYRLTHAVFAGAATYACLASTYWWFFYSELVWPTGMFTSDVQAISGMFDAVWEAEQSGFDSIEGNLFRVPAAIPPGEAMIKATGQALFFPAVMMMVGWPYAAVWAVLSVGLAYKTAQPKELV